MRITKRRLDTLTGLMDSRVFVPRRWRPTVGRRDVNALSADQFINVSAHIILVIHTDSSDVDTGDSSIFHMDQN